MGTKIYYSSGHVIELDDGNYAIQPNNRLRIFDPSMAADPSKPLINRLVNTNIWSVETTSKWITDEHEEGSYDYKYTELKDFGEKLKSNFNSKLHPQSNAYKETTHNLIKENKSLIE